MDRRRMMRSLMLLLALLMAGACTPLGDPALPAEGFVDDFERDSLGDAYRSTGPLRLYRLEGGELHVEGARNRPLWLARKLPRDVRVEFTARSESPAGDIKVEIFGDGVSKATSASYTATGYVIIFGGWNNSRNIIARLDEHGEDRVVGKTKRVEPGKNYKFLIERRGNLLTVAIDGEEIMRLEDPEPLYGRGHDHFAFNNWSTKLAFDDLRITPLR